MSDSSLTQPPPDRQIPRATEILDRATAVFATKGFDGASMQDLSRAAGMSAGNFYRYFPSKDAIIEAIVERDLSHVEAEFAAIMQSSDPRGALIDTILRRIESFADDQEGLLWAEIEAAATRRPEIEKINRRMHDSVLHYLMLVFARIAGISDAKARDRFAAHAELFMILVKGTAVSACAPAALARNAADTGAMNDLVMRVFEHLLSEIAGDGPASTSRS